ncbi:hypothetical protein [Agrobacterium tumefaciens]|uniref:hypothetical protein n=1 Tax=Agrobacterium tumefaciens TaxID=358 RepID=UPI003BA38FC2
MLALWRPQYCQNGVDVEDGERLRRLGLAVVGTNVVPVAWQFVEVLAEREARRLAAVHCAEDLTLENRRVDKGNLLIRMGETAGTVLNEDGLDTLAWNVGKRANVNQRHLGLFRVACESGLAPS